MSIFGKTGLVLVLVVFVVVALGLAFVKPGWARGETVTPSYQNIVDSRTAGSVSIYIVGQASSYIDAGLLSQLGFNQVYKLDSLTSLPVVAEGSLVVVHVDDLSKLKAVDVLDTLTRSLGKTSRLALMILNPGHDAGKAWDVFEIIMKYFGYRGEALIPPLDPNAPIPTDKKQIPPLDPRISTAEALVFSTNPRGIIIVDRLFDKQYILLESLRMSGLINPESGGSVLQSVLGAGTVISWRNVVPLGYVGYITANMTDSLCGVVTGVMSVKLDVLYGNVTTTAGVLYHAWFIHVEHSAVGYETKCYRGPFPTTNYHYPRKFNTTVDWLTWRFPGQVVEDYQPKNMGGGQGISYTVSMAGNPAISVEYGSTRELKDVSYLWADESEPWDGVVTIIHEVDKPGNVSDRDMVGRTFTVEPSSVGFLDPLKPGGALPMIIKAYFTVEDNYGDKAYIAIGAALYPSSYYTFSS
ncbi:MAG: hypothetical protein JHC12_02715 [Thermogladius sp.]|nr:hypothetical protein [Thermogladius sp.]